MAQIFVSYSRADHDKCVELVRRLRKLYGHDNVWFDDEVHGGAKWWDLILSRVEWSDIFVFLVSRESLESPYCKKELQVAMRRGKKILPILVRARANVPRDLAQYQWIDASSGFTADTMTDVTASINALEHEIERSAPVVTPLEQDDQEPPLITDEVKLAKSGVRWWIIGAIIAGLALVVGIIQVLPRAPSSADEPTYPPSEIPSATVHTIMPTVTTTMVSVAMATAEVSAIAESSVVIPTATVSLTDLLGSEGTATLTDAPVVPIGKIAFVSDRDGNDEIYVMNPDGSDQTRLTFNEVDDISPAWSPDGRSIIYSAGPRALERHLYIMDSDGSNQRLLAQGISCGRLQWSPNGESILCGPESGTTAETFILDADGTNPRQVIPPSISAYDPAWSPDGMTIVFVGYRDSDFDLHLIDFDGTNLQRITSGTGTHWYPSFSPDGQLIVYSQGINIGTEVYLITPDGREHQRLGSGMYPNWSPDGNYVVYIVEENGNDEIYTMHADGSGVQRLTDNFDADSYPVWGLAR